MSSEKHIIVIEDNELQREQIKLTLLETGYKVTTASNIKNSKIALKKDQFIMAFLDLGLPDGSGLKLLEWMKDEGLDIPVVVVSAFVDSGSIIKSFKLGALDYLVKPHSEDALIASINNAKKRKKDALPLYQKNVQFVADMKLLTRREQEILGLIVSGKSYKNITEKLCISQNTFKVHAKKIFFKLPDACSGRTEIVFHFNCTDIKTLFDKTDV